MDTPNVNAAPGQSAAAMCETPLADLGELAGPLTHEVNDFLNSLTLHFAVIESMATGELAEELHKVRRQIGRVGDVVKRFQRQRHRPRGEPCRMDVNAAVHEAIAQIQSSGNFVEVIQVVGAGEVPAAADGARAIALDLEHDLPEVSARPADIHRLLRFLLLGALRSVAPGSPPVIVRTARGHGNDSVQIVVEDDGQDLPIETLSRIFEPGNEQREGMCCLQLAVCRSIVRRLDGTLEARPRRGGGLAMFATLRAER